MWCSLDIYHRWRSALIWRAFFTTAVVAVTLRALTDICGRGNCGLYWKGGLITYDVTADTVAYRLADLPPVILLGVIGGVLGSLYNVLMVKVLHVCSPVNEYVQIDDLSFVSIDLPK